MPHVLQAALSENNVRARGAGVKRRLSAFWEKCCGDLIRHDDQQKIQGGKGAGMYDKTQCFSAGLCVCKNGPLQNVFALWFEQNVTRIMKQFFWSKGKDKAKEQSPQRVLLEDSMVVNQDVIGYTFLCVLCVCNVFVCYLPFAISADYD